MTLTHAFLAALAALGLCLLTAGCAKPEPFGRDIWRVVPNHEVSDANR